ncbi:MAG: hypothetical protein WA510_00305 [Acidobacteriaceae bacterium]
MLQEVSWQAAEEQVRGLIGVNVSEFVEAGDAFIDRLAQGFGSSSCGLLSPVVLYAAFVRGFRYQLMRVAMGGVFGCPAHSAA